MEALRLFTLILIGLWVLVFGLGTWVLFVLDQTGAITMTGNPLPALVMATVFTPIFLYAGKMLWDE